MNAEIYDDIFIEEKIDGKIYLMSRPTEAHTDVQGNLLTLFNNHFRRNKKRCVARSEAELYIDEDNWFIPDLMVFCYNTNKDLPLIIVEILSKSTRKKDLGVKMEKYARLGIKEYWIVDCKNFIIDIYLLSESGIYEKYESYIYFVPEDFSLSSEVRTKQEAELNIIKDFSPASFPEMTILLEDVFYFVK